MLHNSIRECIIVSMEPVQIEKLHKQIKVTYTGDKPAIVILKAEFQSEKAYLYPRFQKAGTELISTDSHVWANGRIVYVLGTLQGPPEMDSRRKDFHFDPNILGDKDVYCQDLPSAPARPSSGPQPINPTSNPLPKGNQDHHRSACSKCGAIWKDCRCSFPNKMTIVEGFCPNCGGGEATFSGKLGKARVRRAAKKFGMKLPTKRKK